jgi:tetratricopeptide (TPR) repeat protein
MSSGIFQQLHARLPAAARIAAGLCFCLAAAGAAVGQAAAGSSSTGDVPPSLLTSSFSLTVAPSLELPFGTEELGISGDTAANRVYGPVGASVRLGAQYAFRSSPAVGIGGTLAYHLAPVPMPYPVSNISAEIGGIFGIDVLPRFTVWALASAGGFWSGFSGPDGVIHHGFGGLATGGLGVEFLVSPLMSLGLGAYYRNLLGYYQGLTVALGASFYLSGQAGRQAAIEKSLPLRPGLLGSPKTPGPNEGLAVGAVGFEPVFPVFYKYYDDHPIGTMVLRNQEKKPATDVRLTMYIKQYMDAPKDCPVPASIEPGQTISTDLYALLTSSVFDLTEDTKVMGELTLEYSVGDTRYRDVQTRAIRIHNRNAMNWSDDERAAAFITIRDPSVMGLARKAVSVATAGAVGTVNARFLAAIAVHESLSLQGLRYSSDPSSAYGELSASSGAVDYLQFPIQTLLGRFGDCDDLSILYCSLFESVSIPTAFITVPGHIFMAFATGLSEDEAKAQFGRPEDLLIHEGAAWIPIEITVREGGFLKAWKTGAQEWREAVQKGEAAFYAVQDAWKKYEPVGLPGGGTEVQTPAEDAIRKPFHTELARFVTQEVGLRTASIQDQIQKNGSSPSLQNKLGVAYARFGQVEKAEAAFVLAAGRDAYAPALINLGNLAYQRQDYDKALTWFEKASRLDPENPKILLSLARVRYEKEDFAAARDLYEKVSSLDAELAGRYAYLGAQSTDGARASSTVEAKGLVVWAEE